MMAHQATDWELISNALRRWVEKSTGLQVHMQNETNPFIDPDKMAICRLNILTITQIGHDDRRTTLDATAPAGQECTTEHTGLREMTVSCRVESMTQEPNESARSYLETARTGLRLFSVQRLFLDANISVIEALPITNLDASVDQRIMSMGAFDVRFYVAACVKDEPFASVQVVEIRSNTINDPAGNPVDNQVDLNLNLP